MRDRLSRPYVNRAGKSVSLGWETLPGDYAEDVERMIANDPEALADFREAVKGEPGRPKADEETPYNVRDLQVTCGNGKAYTLSRLKRETPDLFAAVSLCNVSNGVRFLLCRSLRRSNYCVLVTCFPLRSVHAPTKGDFITLKARGTSKDFLAARINRDHPEIAERVKAGDPQHRAVLLWLSMGWPMPPTRWRASSRKGEGAGTGLVLPETELTTYKPAAGPGQRSGYGQVPQRTLVADLRKKTPYSTPYATKKTTNRI